MFGVDIVQMISNSNFSFYDVRGDLYFTEGTAGYGSMYLESGKTYTATNSLKNFSFKVSIKDYYIEEYGYQKTYRKTFIKIDGFNEELDRINFYIGMEINFILIQILEVLILMKYVKLMSPM